MLKEVENVRTRICISVFFYLHALWCCIAMIMTELPMLYLVIDQKDFKQP